MSQVIKLPPIETCLGERTKAALLAQGFNSDNSPSREKLEGQYIIEKQRFYRQLKIGLLGWCGTEKLKDREEIGQLLVRLGVSAEGTQIRSLPDLLIGQRMPYAPKKVLYFQEVTEGQDIKIRVRAASTFY